MTGRVSALLGGEAALQKAEADKQQRLERIEIALSACHREVLSQLSGDRRMTWAFFDLFAKKIKPPPPRRGKADPDADARMLAAYDAAPEGRKEAAVAAAAGANTAKKMNAAMRRVQRLKAERQQREAEMNKVIAKMVSDPENSVTMLWEWARRQNS